MNTKMEAKRVGMVTTLSDRGYGFIACADMPEPERQIGFARRTLAKEHSNAFAEMFVGQTVQFYIEQGPKGRFAQDVQFLEFAGPDQEQVVHSLAPNFLASLTICNAELMRFIRKHPAILDQVHPAVFEEIVASIFRSEGFETQKLSSWNQADGGVDLIAVRKLDGETPIRCAIQCKRVSHERRVSAEPIRALAGVLDHFRAHVGVVATSGRFTQPAKDEVARHLWRISLRDYNDLVASLRRFRLVP